MAHYQYVKLTTGPQGTQGTQGFRGPSSWTPQFTGGVGYGANSNTFYKTSGIDLDWTAQVSSAEGYIRGCYMSFQATSNTGYLLMGLNSDPTVNSSFTSLDYVFYLASGGILIYESNSPVGSFGTYTTNTVFSITYDGYNVRYWVSEPSIPSALLVRTVARPIGSPLYLDSSFYHVSNTIGVTNVVFGPMGETGTQGYQGYQGPAGAGAGFTGTVGTLPKFTGTGTTIGNSIVVESGGRIGIGITPSSAKFEISAGTLGGTLGNYVASQSIFANNANNDIFEMGSLRTATGADWQSAGFRMQQKIDATWMGYIQFNGSGNDYGITFGTGSSTVSRQSIPERMRISSTGVITIPGDLGVGTTSPTAKVHAKSTGASNTVDNYFLDTYNRATISSGGTPTVTYSTQAGTVSIGTLGNPPNANPNTVFLTGNGILNVVSGTWPVFPSNNYNPQLNANGTLLTWAVNVRQSMSGTMTGFGSGQAGQAIVLACNSPNPAGVNANGWALIYGRNGNNSWSLCTFINGLNATGIISVFIGPSAVVTEARVYYSLKVTYSPSTNVWTFYYRNDTPSSSVGLWTNPTTGAFTTVGSATVSSFTDVPLPYFSFVYLSTTGNGYFTNFSLSNTTQLFPDSLKVEDGNNKQTNGYTVLENLLSLNTTTDFTAAALGVPLYGVYRTGNVLRVRTGTSTDAGIVYTTSNQNVAGVKTFTNTGNSQINGIELINNGTGGSYSLFSNNSGAGYGYWANNGASGVGIYCGNTGTGTAIEAYNNAPNGYAIKASNIYAGVGLDLTNGATGQGIIINNLTAATGMPFSVRKSGTDKFTIDDTGKATAAGGFFNSSDARLKDVVERDGATVKFTWKDGPDSKIHIGYIAQEVQEKYPDQVSEDTNGMLTVNYIEVLVAKIQELENRIKQLEK